MEKIKKYGKWFLGSFIWIGILVLGLDLLSKLLVVANKDYIQETGGIVLIPNFLRINYVINNKVVFGIDLFKNDTANRAVFCVVALLICIGIIFYLIKKWDKTGKMMKGCLIAVVAGAIGNVIDRIFYTPEFLGVPYNGVVDWIDFYGIWGFNFNVADAAVVVSAILLIIYMIVTDLIEYIQIHKKDKAENPKEDKKEEKVLSKTEREKNKYLETKDE